MTKLLYRLVPHNGGAVFAKEERAFYIANIHQAISTAKTWAEFRSRIPSVEYKKIMARLLGDEEGQTEPDPSAKFSSSGITDEGDYPDWLQLEMDYLIPRDVREKFGTRADTFLNGSYWHIPEEDMEPMANALRERGFLAIEAEELPFH
jgi:hypothetical protein